MSRNPNEQLVHFLSDMYSVELQALAQLESAPEMAGDARLAEDLRRHRVETEQHAALVHQRLEAHGGSPSAVKDAIMKLGGKGFLAFARAMPETPARLAAHAYAYEAMEWAGYEMLIGFAEAGGDTKTVVVAQRIREQERAMMERLEKGFNAAEDASHRDTPFEKMGDQVRKHLEEAHALESQGIELLSKSHEIAGEAQFEMLCGKHLGASQKHAQLIETRLKSLGATPSGLKDAALAFGGLNWSYFFQAQSDTPAKLAAFIYAFEHLKIAGYELLMRGAGRNRDAETAGLCENILTEERAMAEQTTQIFASAVQATLAAVEV